MLELLSGGRAGLVTDIDGTISPIVGTPEDALVLPAAREGLRVLSGVLTLVAVVSGRSAAQARAMVGLEGLTYVGNHGFELWSDHGPQTVPAAQAWVPRVAAVLDDVRTQIRQPGIVIEDKGATAAVHYRLAANPERVQRELRDILVQTALPAGLRFEEGRMVFNLLPPLSISKGSAVSWLAAEHRLERLVYVGDDETDARAFGALRALRQSGEVRTLNIAVVGSETPLSVRRLAEASLPSVEAVAELLGRLAEQLKSEC
ncbi:MAG: trehalose-phosphatase [Chloroflexota bacterium]|nr:trehalose-phosphatase [Chloroflexota bacterium]